MMDERQYVRKVLKGDSSAFAYFVETYQDMAVTIAHRICRNRQDAEDIVQNAFVKAYHKLHTFRVESKFSTWFYRIVFNTAITHIRAGGFNTEFEDYKVVDTDNSYSDWGALEQIHEEERRRIINQAMDKMPTDEALVLTLFYLEENSIKDIVLITGMTESNVKVKLHRSRKRFAEILTPIVRSENIVL